MALKDWKKEGRTMWAKKDSIVQVSKSDFPKGWTLSIVDRFKDYNNYHLIKEVTLNTKKEAINKAREYMRTH